MKIIKVSFRYVIGLLFNKVSSKSYLKTYFCFWGRGNLTKEKYFNYLPSQGVTIFYLKAFCGVSNHRYLLKYMDFRPKIASLNLYCSLFSVLTHYNIC